MTGPWLASATLLFANEDPHSFEIDIRHSAAEHFASASAGVGSETEHRIDERLQVLAANVVEDFLNLRDRQEKRIPERFLVPCRQYAATELPLNIVPSL